ncbi:Ger(x)C family spore germination protein [Bacillus sp. RAR_GA_16]|uniref:Ger(x)C family spore germination protein n=1 Tax=Bacillus sp. RAR_GA_16 TaxID=2876774 RepID=UPI001CCC37C0|nr:Ger(x)C family spore germination protein [Bacillus sp. RAR_GA_16]MCA0171384.1 Ger(x)C family spore germination protein [Bacillus sp. RAR_GA_16]
MKRKYRITLLIIVILLTSCSDIKEVQKLNYATAIGIDYFDDQYHCYIQMVGLNSIAKTEGGGENEPQVWVSEASGKTFNDALFDVYNTAQERIIWSHVSSIVLGEGAVKEGFETIFDGMIRYNEFRLTPWVFGTQNDMKELLSTVGFYNQAALDTLLHNPTSIYEQSSLIKPIKLQRLAREYYEPTFTTYIPSVTINSNQWEKNMQDDPKIAYDGAFFFTKDHYKGFFDLVDLSGLRWITPETDRTSILISSEGQPQYLIVIDDVSVKKEIVKSKRGRYVDLKVDVKGYLTNRSEGSDKRISKITNRAAEKIEKEIEELFLLGLENVKTVKEFVKKVTSSKSLEEGNDLKDTVHFNRN